MAPVTFDLYGKLAAACDDVGRQRMDEDFLQHGHRVVVRFKPIIEAYLAHITHAPDAVMILRRLLDKHTWYEMADRPDWRERIIDAFTAALAATRATPEAR